MDNKSKKRRNIIKYSSIAVCSAIVLTGVGIAIGISNNSNKTLVGESSVLESSILESSVLSTPSVVESTDFKITLKVKNKEIQLSETEKQKILELCEESLENNNSLLNLLITMEEVDDCKKNGLFLELNYENEKEFTMMEYPTMVHTVNVLIGDKHSYFMVNKGAIYGYFSKELYETLKGYIE